MSLIKNYLPYFPNIFAVAVFAILVAGLFIKDWGRGKLVCKMVLNLYWIILMGMIIGITVWWNAMWGNAVIIKVLLVTFPIFLLGILLVSVIFRRNWNEKSWVIFLYLLIILFPLLLMRLSKGLIEVTLKSF